MIPLFLNNWGAVILCCLVMGIAGFLYRRYRIAYEFVYFARKARRLAVIKTILMVALLLLLFVGAEWVFALFLQPGYLRSTITFALPFLLLNVLWEPTEAWLDRRFDPR